MQLSLVLACVGYLLLTGCCTQPSSIVVAIGKKPGKAEVERLVLARLRTEFRKVDRLSIQEPVRGSVYDWRQGSVLGWVVEIDFESIDQIGIASNHQPHSVVIREGKIVLLRRHPDAPTRIIVM